MQLSKHSTQLSGALPNFSYGNVEGDALGNVECDMPCEVEGDASDVEGEGDTSVVACTS